jgi:hypothetical protein
MMNIGLIEKDKYSLEDPETEISQCLDFTLVLITFDFRGSCL